MKKLIYALLVFTAVLFLCACGKSEEIDFYSANMEQFFSNVKTIDGLINGIDVTQEGYEDKLLKNLDLLNNSFKQMSTLEVPNSLIGVKELAEDAASNMSTAVDKYHAAYSSEEFDSVKEYEAYQYYIKANRELQYIIRILHGEEYDDVITDTGVDSESDIETNNDSESE